jgi:peptidyl-prolyl cis-trans isomerase D
MIQWMHRLTQSWVASVLMGLLALSFIVWGIADVFTGSSDTTAIKVGSTQISVDAFGVAYRQFLRQASLESKTEITNDEARKEGLPRIEVQNLVSRTALLNMAHDMGTEASQQDAAAEIRSMRQFAGTDGSFDHRVFLQVMQNNSLTEDGFIAEVRGDKTIDMLQKAVTEGFQAPDSYTLTLLAYLSERRAADYILVTPEMVGAIPTPSDAVLAAYVKSHAGRFSTPEYRDVSYAEVSPQDVMGQIQVSEAQIQQEYDARKSGYVIAETRDLQQLEFPTLAAAQAARAKLDKGMSFDALAASEHKTQAQISLGTLAQGDILDSDRAQAAFALTANQVSQPVKSASGWVLMRATKINPGVTKTLADVHDEIKTALAAELAQSKMTDIANVFQDARAAGDDIPTAAKKAGMKSGHIAAMDSHGLDPDGKKIDAASDPEFIAAVFKSDVGDDVDPFPTKAGAYYALKVNGSTPPKLKPLDAVRAEALAAWTSEQRGILLSRKAMALAAQAKSEKSLAGISKSLGAPIQKSPGLDRGVADKVFGPQILSALFDTPPNGIVAGPSTDNGGYVIAQLTGVAHPRPAGGMDFLRYETQRLSAQIAQDIPVSLANAGRDKQGVTVNQKLIDTVTGDGS